jgi:hypothetical protein
MIESEETTKDIQKIDEFQHPEKSSGTEMLLKLAVDKDLDVDKLKALIQLKNDEEVRQAKKDFDFHFTEMQKEFEPIEKTEEGYGYKYAPLPMLIKKYGPIIAKHGFSYRWRETKLENGDKRVTIIISGWGYTDDHTDFDIPKIEGTERQNSIQVAGTMSTYGQRYTFKAGFGIVEIGEDTDGVTYDDGVEYAQDIKLIRDCTTTQDLYTVFKGLWEKYLSDPKGQEIISREKDTRKKELKNGNS